MSSTVTEPIPDVASTPVMSIICASSIVNSPTLAVDETPVISAGPNSRPSVPTLNEADTPDIAAGPNSKTSVPKFAVAA